MTKISSSIPRITTKLASSEFIQSSFDTFLFDGGGVLWREQFPIEGAIQLVNSLISAGKKVWIVTNSSRRDAEENAQKCTKLGFKGLTASNIVASGMVLVHYIKKLKAMPQYSAIANLPIYLIGTKGLQQLLTRNGVESFGPGILDIGHSSFWVTPGYYKWQQFDAYPFLRGRKAFHFDNLHHFISKQPVFAVVTAFDEHISYPKIVKATNYLANPQVPFLATNTDAVFPGPEPGSLIPGAGTVFSPISYVSGRQPIVMGKPSRTCWEYICEQCEANGEKIEPNRTIMIGDRLDTDILFGHNSGLATLLVLTGVTPTLEDAERMAKGDAGLVPDFYVPTLSHLLLPNDKN